MSAARSQNHRILVIDDVAEIHTVFRRLLCPKAKLPALASLESSLFEKSDTPRPDASFEVDTALQGEEGLRLVQSALADGRPYAMAFVDMRMPPGWDGLQTIEAIWRVYPDLEVVICTAYSDYSDADIVKRIGVSDQVLFLRKPFDAIEVRQLARALTEKWSLRQQAHLRQAELEHEHELLRAQRLEAVGQLTAAVAGELDTFMKVLTSAVDDARRYLPADPLKHELTTSSARALADATAAATQATRRMAGLVQGLTKLAAESPPPRR